MKKVTTIQFAELAGMAIQNLHVYKNRGKINVMDEESDGHCYVDLDDPLNAHFLATRTAKLGNVIRAEDIDPKKLPKSTIRKLTVKKANNKIRKERKKPRAKQELIKPVTEYEKHKTEKMQQDAELAKLRLEQLKGRVIPINETQMIFGLHFANVSAEFYNAVDNYTVIVVDKLGGGRKELAHFRSKLREIVNKAVEDAKEKTRKEIQQKAEEYAKSRRIGEIE